MEDGLIERMLPLSVGLLNDMEKSDSTISELVTPLDNVTYEVNVVTGALASAETTANVFLTLFDLLGNVLERQLVKPTNTKFPFSRGQVRALISLVISLTSLLARHLTLSFGSWIPN